MSEPRFVTVAEPATAQFEIQGSTFIGHIRPTGTLEDAEAFIEHIRSEYDDATHNVPAYRVRTGDQGELLREYQSDDGEPSGSAGKPALNVLQGQELENTAVVVTRYYGGTNLGVGGLVSAYGQAVKDAIEHAGTVEREPTESITVVVEYDDSGTVRGILESSGVDFTATYESEVSFEVTVPVAGAASLRDRLRSATSGRVELS